MTSTHWIAPPVTAKLEYVIESEGEAYPDDACECFNPYKGDDTSGAELAELAAEDHHSNHDGWESSWPLRFSVYLDGEFKGAYEVERDAMPVFSASLVTPP